MKSRKKKKLFESPIEQPGGEMLIELSSILLLWSRGEIYSDEAISKIAEYVCYEQVEWFEGCFESFGWRNIHLENLPKIEGASK